MEELYANRALRRSILRAMRNVVEPQTQAQTEGRKSEAKRKRGKTLEYLRGRAKTWLAVLFNVFASAGRGDHGVSGKNELAGAYRTVLGPTSALPSPQRRCRLGIPISHLYTESSNGMMQR